MPAPFHRRRSPQEVIDRLLRRPSFWRADRPLPVLLVPGAGLAPADLTRPHEGRLPLAHICADREAPLRELVEELAGEHGRLGRSMLSSLLPPPRFPLTRFVLWARAQRPEEVPADITPALEVEVRQRFRAWRRKLASDRRARFAALDYFGRTITVWLPGATLVTSGFGRMVSLAAWAWGLGAAFAGALAHAFMLLAGPGFYRWFRRQEFLTRGRDESVAHYAVQVALAEEDDYDRLLVHALLEDLRQAYQRRIIPWPGWGRGWYGLLVLEDMRPGGVAHRFLRVTHEVVERTGLPGPLLVIATGAVPGFAEPAPLSGPLDEVVAEWTDRSRRATRCPHVVVTAAEPDEAYLAAKPRPRRLRALGYWAVVLSLIVVPSTAAGAATFGCGPGLTRRDGQCVGVTDDPFRFDPDPVMRPFLAKIKAQNEAIPATDPVAELVYFGPLTVKVKGTNRADMYGDAGELAGLAARQDVYNSYKRHGKRKIRILFANAGEQFGSAVEVAEQIARLPARDLVGVMGLSQSRESVHQAIRILDAAHLVMVSTTATADRIATVDGRRSSWFFRMGATNSGEAAAMKWWLDRGLPGGGTGLSRIYVLEEENSRDIYSMDLAAALRRALPKSKDLTFTDDRDLNDAVGTACSEGAQVLVYTGRTDLLTKVVEAWRNCPAKPYILASSDVTSELEKGSTGIDQRKLLFVAVSELDGTVPDPNVEGDFTHVYARVAYEGAWLVTEALDDVEDDVAHLPSEVRYNLRGRCLAALGIGFDADRVIHDARGRSLWLLSDGPGGVKKEAEYPITPPPDCP